MSGIIVWFLAGIFLLITILLLSGKGAFLIAGYNTASKKEKMQYNEKKLCRVMGSGMGVITIFMVVLASFGENPPDWLLASFPAVIILVVVVMLILCNTICKVKDFVTEEEIEGIEKTEKEKRHESIIKISSIIVSMMFCVILGIILLTGEVKVTLEDKEIEIQGSFWIDYQVPLDSINTISFREDLLIGKRTGGFGSLKLNQGNFRNDEFGAYTLYAYTKCDSFVVLDTDDRMVVINAETHEETKELYNNLKEALSK
ncbi:DUF3784 domain-containing protein [Alloiococcus sp. CFN-8]|uniref:DUF3784 domain-containing protein n=1 Tax=Alloiococcus sp. CFN-8 TaxID=3416081 RepID=UPI003CF4B7E1